jgi:hypothetical protein
MINLRRVQRMVRQASPTPAPRCSARALGACLLIGLHGLLTVSLNNLLSICSARY